MLSGHARLLLAWNGAINLTAIRDPAALALRHVVDSLTAVPILGRGRGRGRGRPIDGLLDLGSGAGYPGIPLAAVLPLERVALVDSVGKKASFLRAAVAATGLASRVAVTNNRAEHLAHDPHHRERWPAVTARAVGALPDLVELALPLLLADGILVAWKRGAIEEEVEAARRAVDALGGGRIETLPVEAPSLAGHVLVVVTKRGRTAGGFPRDPAARRRRPW